MSAPADAEVVVDQDDGIRHGTTQYETRKCRRLYGRSCQACRDADAAKVRHYRALRPELEAATARRNGARAKAARELARRYPEEFAELYRAELRVITGGTP